MLGPWASEAKEILNGFSNDLLCFNYLAQVASKLWMLKVDGPKLGETFWVRGYSVRDFV